MYLCMRLYLHACICVCGGGCGGSVCAREVLISCGVCLCVEAVFCQCEDGGWGGGGRGKGAGGGRGGCFNFVYLENPRKCSFLGG